jgi:hypothetical protein
MTASLIAQLALATFVVVQFTKFLLDGLVSPSNPNQNNIVRLYVYAVAIVVCAVALPLSPIRDYVSALADAKTLLVDGFLVFSAAVSSYHIATGLDTPALMASVVSTLKPHTPEPVATEPAPAPTPEATPAA